MYEDFREHSETGEDFIQMDLESRDHKKRINAAEIVRKLFRDASEVFNSYILRNSKNLLKTLPHNRNDIARYNETKI